VIILSGCGGVSSENYNAKSQSEIVNDSTKSLTTKEFAPPINTKALVTSEGTLVYKFDSVMVVDVITRVEARIIEGNNDSIVNNLLAMTTATENGVIKTETIKVGKIMDMELVVLDPEAFTITKISSGDQPVDRSSVTEWLWGVTAKKIGRYDMILKAKIKSDNSIKDIIVFDKRVMVMNKPKRMYNISLEIPERLKRYEESTIKMSLVSKKSDTYSFEWGGSGNVVLDVSDKFKITEFNTYDLNDDKALFNYKWIIEPISNEDSLLYTIKIIGDYDELVIAKNNIPIDKNFKATFNNLSDEAIKRWYWFFTALLVPIYNILQKKYFPHKKLFKRKKRKLNK
jgi:hypothetical protein